MRLLTTFVAVLVLASTAWAQSTSSLLNDPGTKVLGSFTVSTAVLNGGTTSDGQPLARAKAKPATGDIVSEIIFMRTSEGKIDYMINTSSIQIQNGAETWSTETIFNTIAAAAVVEGTNRGITGCVENGSIVTTVWAHSCIERSYNKFTVLNADLLSSRDYSVRCEPTNGTLIQLKAVNDPGCTGYNSIQ